MTQPNTLRGTAEFRTHPLLLSWAVTIAIIVFGCIPPLIWGWRVATLVIGGGLIAFGVVRAVLVLLSEIRVSGGELCVRHDGLRTRCIQLAALTSVKTRTVFYADAPELLVAASGGTLVRIRLDAWRREEQLIGIIADAAARSGASVDAHAAEILRDRPSPGSWHRRPRSMPRTVIGRWIARLPRLARWPATVGLWLLALVALYGGLDLAARFSENVLFPRHVDPAWVQQVEVVGLAGDTWLGNLAPAGDGFALATRERIDGFWGSIRVRRTDDGGLTWSAPVPLSGDFDAARHVMVAGPDGSLVAAWAERGPQVATQRLVMRQSLDGGRSWSPTSAVGWPSGGLVGVPAIVMTNAVRVIAFTDGATGEIWAQPLTPDRLFDGRAIRVGQSTRQLYNDALFDDGSLAVTSIGRHVVLSYVDGGRHLHVALSDDAGYTWRAAPIDQLVAGGQARMATDGSKILIAAIEPDVSSRGGRRPFIRIDRSDDGGATWARGPSVSDVARLGLLELAWSAGRWRLLYDGCPGLLSCATKPRIWYATSNDGRAWSGASVVSEPGSVNPIGVAAGVSRASVVWATRLADHDWRFHVAVGQDR